MATSSLASNIVAAVILEASEDVAILQADVGVWVHVALEITVRSHDLGFYGIAQVKERRAPASEGVGEQEATRGHRQLSVMRSSGGTGHRDRSHHLAVFRRGWIRVEYGKEVAALFGVIPCPDEQVLTLLRHCQGCP